jgi:hypothetical protein
VDELPPNARTFLKAVQRADDPTPTERARADATVRAALASHGVRDLPALVPLTPAAVSRAASRVWSVTLAVTAALLIGAGLFAFVALRQTPPSPRALPPAVIQAPRAVPRIAPPSEESIEPGTLVEHANPEQAPAHHAKNTPPRRASAPKRSASELADDDGLQRALRVVAAANELIRRARFHEALQLLEETESDPAARVMREERTALRILAMCGRAPDAHAMRERERFLLDSPRAVLATRVREACVPARVTEP